MPHSQGVRDITPTTGGRPLYYGTNVADDIARERMLNGLPARGPNINLLDHINGVKGRAFRGTTEVMLTRSARTGEQGAAVWAGPGGWVFEIDGTVSWNVADVLQGGAMLPDGSFRGTLMAGEIEHAILAQVPTERIVGIHKVVVAPGGVLAVKPIMRNPNYRPLRRA